MGCPEKPMVKKGLNPIRMTCRSAKSSQCCALKKQNAQGSLQPCGLSPLWVCVVVQTLSLLPSLQSSRPPHANLLIVPNRELKVQRHGTVSSCLTCPSTLKQGSRDCAIWVSRSATRLCL